MLPSICLSRGYHTSHAGNQPDGGSFTAVPENSRPAENFSALPSVILPLRP
ncbi:hypothetical protein APS_1388 [Acetobacter pasteurianus subsp. pasteurianus LMG 1262 = NBRC 106471]|nr:hypothetical protein APS_1388 [Acetobacter pasteurianus subsp. pasteurianus LMG 1262 = NBRC 106471]